MSNMCQRLVIVEGESREVMYFNSIQTFFGREKDFAFLVLPAEQNIYMLWSKLKKDKFETDIIELLREMEVSNIDSLNGLTRDDISEIFLFFDYDGHHDNLKKEDLSEDVVGQMLTTFSDETEHGKLYISYPMIESLRDFSSHICRPYSKCLIEVQDKYKALSGKDNPNSNVKKYDEQTWKKIINFFVIRLSCFCDSKKIIDYKDYKKIKPLDIYNKQQRYINNNKIFVLSSIPEFLLDYFDLNFWESYTEISAKQEESYNRRVCEEKNF